MLFAKLVLTVALAGSTEARFRLLDERLTVVEDVAPGHATKRCPSLYPTVATPAPPPLSTPAPDAAVKKSLTDAFGGRTRASSCMYGLQGVRRHDPRFGMREVTLELTPPAKSPVRLLLRTVVGRFAPMQDLRHSNAEIYAGISY